MCKLGGDLKEHCDCVTEVKNLDTAVDRDNHTNALDAAHILRKGLGKAAKVRNPAYCITPSLSVHGTVNLDLPDGEDAWAAYKKLVTSLMLQYRSFYTLLDLNSFCTHDGTLPVDPTTLWASALGNLLKASITLALEDVAYQPPPSCVDRWGCWITVCTITSVNGHCRDCEVGETADILHCPPGQAEGQQPECCVLPHHYCCADGAG